MCKRLQLWSDLNVCSQYCFVKNSQNSRRWIYAFKDLHISWLPRGVSFFPETFRVLKIICCYHRAALPLCSTEYSQLFSLLNGMPHTHLVLDAAALYSLPTLLIHWLVDWEASLAIWENNVISGWAELLNPLWDYSLLSASVITDHRQEKEKKVFPLLYAAIFIPTSSVWWVILNRFWELAISLYSLLLFSTLAVWQRFKVQQHKLCSLLYSENVIWSQCIYE